VLAMERRGISLMVTGSQAAQEGRTDGNRTSALSIPLMDASTREVVCPCRRSPLMADACAAWYATVVRPSHMPACIAIAGCASEPVVPQSSPGRPFRQRHCNGRVRPRAFIAPVRTHAATFALSAGRPSHSRQMPSETGSISPPHHSTTLAPSRLPTMSGSRAGCPGSTPTTSSHATRRSRPDEAREAAACRRCPGRHDVAEGGERAGSQGRSGYLPDLGW
jgi:hypothetical protein